MPRVRTAVCSILCLSLLMLGLGCGEPPTVDTSSEEAWQASLKRVEAYGQKHGDPAFDIKRTVAMLRQESQGLPPMPSGRSGNPREAWQGLDYAGVVEHRAEVMAHSWRWASIYSDYQSAYLEADWATAMAIATQLDDAGYTRKPVHTARIRGALAGAGLVDQLVVSEPVSQQLDTGVVGRFSLRNTSDQTVTEVYVDLQHQHPTEQTSTVDAWLTMPEDGLAPGESTPLEVPMFPNSPAAGLPLVVRVRGVITAD